MWYLSYTIYYIKGPYTNLQATLCIASRDSRQSIDNAYNSTLGVIKKLIMGWAGRVKENVPVGISGEKREGKGGLPAWVPPHKILDAPP